MEQVRGVDWLDTVDDFNQHCNPWIIQRLQNQTHPTNFGMTQLWDSRSFGRRIRNEFKVQSLKCEVNPLQTLHFKLQTYTEKIIMAELQGLQEVLKNVSELRDKKAIQIAHSSVNAGLNPLTKSLRSAVNTSSASNELKRAARQTIGKRIVKQEGDIVYGKFGFAVGKRPSANSRKAQKAQARKQLYQKGGARGVGISTNNIHWGVLGTQERTTKGSNATTLRGKQISRGVPHRTGRMKPIFAGLIERAVSSSKNDVLAAMQKKASQILEKK